MSGEESATHKNILAIRDHSQRTREIVRDLESRLVDMGNSKTELEMKVEILQSQIQNLQVKMFTGGATS